MSIPEPWATRLVERGYTDRRSKRDDIPSYGALADELGVNTTTLSEAMTGKRTPNPATVIEMMDKLGADIAQWLGLDYHGEWKPPAEAALLDGRQRKAVEELIRSIVAARAEERAQEPQSVRSDFVLQARRTHSGGPSRGQAQRHRYDKLGETPQEEGPEEGA